MTSATGCPAEFGVLHMLYVFIAGAVAVGMFGMASVSGVIMASHYLAAIGVGLLMRFYKARADRSDTLRVAGTNVFTRAAQAMLDARQKDSRPLGQLMGDAIRQSVNSLLAIGGFIILFSSIISILEIAGVTSVISLVFTLLLRPLGVDTATVPSLVGGLFEITIGTQMASQANASLVQRLMAASAIIAWSGLSVHAQVAAMMQGTDVEMGPYVAARLLHAILAGAICYVLMGPLAAIADLLAVPAASVALTGSLNWVSRASLSLACFFRAFGLFAGAALCCGLARVARRQA